MDLDKIENLLLSPSIGLLPGSFNINPNGVVDILHSGADVESGAISNGKLMIKFGKVVGAFYVTEVGVLTSMENFPDEIDGDLRVVHQPQLSSWAGAPKRVTGNFTIRNCGFADLSGIPELTGTRTDNTISRFISTKLKSLVGIEKVKTKRLVISYSPDLPLLRLLRIPHDTDLMISEVDHENRLTSTKVTDACEEIITAYRKLGDQSPNKILLACQRSLMNAGFVGNARY